MYESIKIKGAHVQVYRSGRGYITLHTKEHSVTVEMDDNVKKRINAMSSEDHVKPWVEEMEKLYIEALKQMRVKLKKR